MSFRTNVITLIQPISQTNVHERVSGNIKVQYSFDEGTVKLAKIELYNKLYVAGWELSYDLQRVIEMNGTNGTSICLIYKDNIPVAVTIICKYTGNISSFTRKKERLKGFGKLAIHTLIQNTPNNWTNYVVKGHNMGSLGCDKFFEKCGLYVSISKSSRHYGKS